MEAMRRPLAGAPFVVLGRILRRMAITVTADEVLEETASLMSYLLRQGGFVAGQGGEETPSFTTQTTPTLAHATRVVTRNAGIVVRDFAQAEEEDRDELVTIAALRSAIELENSTPSIDDPRIENWRAQLREFTGRFSDGGSGDEPPDPAAALAPKWSFPGPCAPHPPGGEMPYPTKTGNEDRWLNW